MAKPKQPVFTPEDIEAAEAQIVESSKRIEFFLTEYSVELLATKTKENEFVVPSYQREFTWEPARKSRFIESLVMGLPIPFLFFWEMPDGRLEIVDGSQRLRTIAEYVLGDLRLGELSSLSLLSNTRFSDLPESRKRKIRNRSIRGIVLGEHADEQARFDMFERINTGSKIARGAEIRRGALTGKFLELVIELANDELFASLAPATQAEIDKREREELVTRFFAYGDGLDTYRDRPSTFLFEYSKRMDAEMESNPALVEQYRDRFGKTMRFVQDVFPMGFRKTAKGKKTYRARFEAIAIGSYEAMKVDESILDRANAISVEPWLSSKEFQNATGSDGANAVGRLRHRIAFVRDKVLGS